jgi:hypothetical protein
LAGPLIRSTSNQWSGSVVQSKRETPMRAVLLAIALAVLICGGAQGQYLGNYTANQHLPPAAPQPPGTFTNPYGNSAGIERYQTGSDPPERVRSRAAFLARPLPGQVAVDDQRFLRFTSQASDLVERLEEKVSYHPADRAGDQANERAKYYTQGLALSGFARRSRLRIVPRASNFLCRAR